MLQSDFRANPASAFRNHFKTLKIKIAMAFSAAEVEQTGTQKNHPEFTTIANEFAIFANSFHRHGETRSANHAAAPIFSVGLNL